jgi:hypothetical protein
MVEWHDLGAGVSVAPWIDRTLPRRSAEDGPEGSEGSIQQQSQNVVRQYAACLASLAGFLEQVLLPEAGELRLEIWVHGTVPFIPLWLRWS